MRGYLSLLLTVALLVGAIAAAECVDSEPAGTIPPFFTLTSKGVIEHSPDPYLQPRYGGPDVLTVPPPTRAPVVIEPPR